MYLSYSELTVQDLSSENISKLYSQGFLFTRKSKGNLYQTRSLRIDLGHHQPNSENRRIYRKNEIISLKTKTIPIVNYNWHIHYLGKLFYSQRFGDLTFSAQKIKELVTDHDESNMNLLFSFHKEDQLNENNNPVGHSICYENYEILHYAYPFYDLTIPKEQNLGMGMMLKAIEWAKQNGKKYVYLGSVAEPASKYKLQFEGLEWWNNDSKSWSKDIDSLKILIGV